MITENSLPKYQRLLLECAKTAQNPNFDNEIAKKVFFSYTGSLLKITENEAIASLENLLNCEKIWTGHQGFNRIMREKGDPYNYTSEQVAEYRNSLEKFRLTLEK